MWILRTRVWKYLSVLSFRSMMQERQQPRKLLRMQQKPKRWQDQLSRLRIVLWTIRRAQKSRQLRQRVSQTVQRRPLTTLSLSPKRPLLSVSSLSLMLQTSKCNLLLRKVKSFLWSQQRSLLWELSAMALPLTIVIGAMLISISTQRDPQSSQISSLSVMDSSTLGMRQRAFSKL